MRIKNPYKVRHYQVGGAITQNPAGLEGFTGGYESAVKPKWENLHNFNSPYGASVGSNLVSGNAIGSASQPGNIEELTQYAQDNSVALNKEIKDMTPEQIQWWKDTMGFGDTWDWLTNLIGGDTKPADNPYQEGTPESIAFISNEEKDIAMADAAASDSGLWAQLTGTATGDYEQGLMDYDLETRPDAHILPTAPVDVSIFDEPVTGGWTPGVGNDPVVTTPVVQEPLVTGGWTPGVGNPPVVVNTPTPVTPPQLSIDTVAEVVASKPNITVSHTPAPAPADPVVTDYGDAWHPGVGSTSPGTDFSPKPEPKPEPKPPTDTGGGWHPGVGSDPVVSKPDPKPEPSKPATSRPEPKPSTQTSKPSVVETFTNWVSSWEW